MGQMVLKVLSEGEIERIHEKTLEMLAATGFKITHDEALKKLKKAGAKVNEATGMVKVPTKMVQELLSLAPSVAIETGLNGKVMELGGDRRYYLSLILDPFVVDYDEGLRRPVLEDVRRHTIIGESLDRVSAMMRMQFPVADIPEPDSYYKTMETFLTHTTKHTAIYPTSDENCRDWMDVAEIIAEQAGLDVKDTPLMSVAMAVTSPLQIHGFNVEIMKMAMERCYPILPTVCPMAGTTSPYSVAGTTLLSNIETLLPVLIAQVYKPGHPVFYTMGPSVTDLKTGSDLYYKAEKMLFKTAACQMGKYYNLPIAGEAGGSFTYRADVQNGAESFAYLLASLAVGQNMMGGLGSLHNANGMSAEQIIMQCGLVDMVEYVAAGVDTSDYKLGCESIRQAGAGGNYLTDRMTLDLMHADEFFKSEYMDFTGGYDDSTKGMYEIAHEKALELVNNYQPMVPEKVVSAVKDFFRAKYQDERIADL